MAREARLDWLLGDERPVRVIPARITEREEAAGEHDMPEVADEAHEALSKSGHHWEHAHEDGIHRKTLHHPDGTGIVEVHSASLVHLDAHLDSVSISMRSPTSSRSTVWRRLRGPSRRCSTRSQPSHDSSWPTPLTLK